jgi:hypothetical protein
MPPQITFTAYVISIIDANRICVRVDDDHVERISSLMSYYNDKTTVKDTIGINTGNAHFVINMKWDELSDLKGTNVKVVATLRRYSYWKNKEMLNERNERYVTSVKYRGVSIIASRVSSINAVE